MCGTSLIVNGSLSKLLLVGDTTYAQLYSRNISPFLVFLKSMLQVREFISNLIVRVPFTSFSIDEDEREDSSSLIEASQFLISSSQPKQCLCISILLLFTTAIDSCQLLLIWLSLEENSSELWSIIALSIIYGSYTCLLFFEASYSFTLFWTFDSDAFELLYFNGALCRDPFFCGFPDDVLLPDFFLTLPICKLSICLPWFCLISSSGSMFSSNGLPNAFSPLTYRFCRPDESWRLCLPKAL